jgi:hypothetical protein
MSYKVNSELHQIRSRTIRSPVATVARRVPRMSDEGGNTLRTPTWFNQINRVACITFRAAGTIFQPDSQLRLSSGG